MARAREPRNGELEAALKNMLQAQANMLQTQSLLSQTQATLSQTQATLAQNQAAADARIAESDRHWAELVRHWAELERRWVEIERRLETQRLINEERFARIETVLNAHTQMLERLMEAVREKIGFRPPG